MTRVRTRRTALSVVAATALALGGVVIGASPAAAAIIGPVDPALADGAANSLRDVIENQVADGDTVLLVNGATYVLDDCAEGALNMNGGADVTIQAQNTGTGVANAVIQQTCRGAVIDDDDNSLVLTNITITGGRNIGSGGGILNVDNLTLNQVLMTDNNTGNDGAAFNASGNVTITNSTIANNCSFDDGAAFRLDGVNELTITNSTIANNVGEDDGAVDAADSHTVLSFVTFGSNTMADDANCAGVEEDALGVEEDAAEAAGDVGAQQVTPANLLIDAGTLTAFGTAMIQPVGAPNCDIDTENGGVVTSLGYNFSDDATCLFTNVATGDRENAGDPGLGALGANGGPTPTRLPGATSPLVNFIPSAVCQAFLTSEGITTDQRGITRPQATGCEIGSVEIQVIVAEPTFTG